MKHTPGPWIVGGRYTVRTPSRSSDWICRTRDQHHGHDDDEDEANAHLIAAAPDMYESLAMMVSAVTGSGDATQALSYARAAIAKAEGNGTA